jgi:NAD dependent epimerase/dehydratase family enzyme
VLTGQRVLPKKALSLGYSFRYPTIDAALAEMFSEAPQP